MRQNNHNNKHNNTDIKNIIFMLLRSVIVVSTVLSKKTCLPFATMSGLISIVVTSSCLVFFLRCVASAIFGYCPFYRRCCQTMPSSSANIPWTITVALSSSITSVSIYITFYHIFFFSRSLAHHEMLIHSIAPYQTHSVQSTEKSHIVLAIFVISNNV